jgi:hypothetical protein
MPHLPWTAVLLFTPLCSWDDRFAPPPAFIKDSVLRTSLPGLVLNSVVLMNSSGVVRVTGVSHCIWPTDEFWVLI